MFSSRWTPKHGYGRLLKSDILIDSYEMSDNKKIARNSGILYIRLFIITVIGLISSRIVLHYLGVSDFGLYSVVGGIVVMMSLLNTAMISTSFRYIAFEVGKGNTEEVNKVFNISLILHACLSLIVVLLAETVGTYYIHHFLNVPADRIPDAIFVFRLSVLATVFSIFSVPFSGAYYRSGEVFGPVLDRSDIGVTATGCRNYACLLRGKSAQIIFSANNTGGYYNIWFVYNILL